MHTHPTLKLWGLGFRVWGLGFRVWGLGFRVSGFGFQAAWASAFCVDAYGEQRVGLGVLRGPKTT